MYDDPRMHRTIVVEWRRLVENGSTCGRCSSTGENIISAVTKVNALLEPKRIRVDLHQEEIPKERFLEDPLLSNDILIDGKRIEDWIGAKTGSSPCSGVCGSSNCRTLEACGDTYEEIPESMIILAIGIALKERGWA